MNVSAAHQSDLPVASVVTTVYNREQTLARAMASVLAQSFTDFEYIIVDDGSTDSSAHIAESSGDPRVRALRETHHGRPAALNTAFSLCRGRYILIQDSDDIALPGRFAEQISCLEQHPDTGMLGCDVLLTDPAETSRRILRLPREHENIRQLMPLTSAVIFGACCIRTAHIPDTLRFDESMSAAEDYAFQLQLLRVTRFHNLPLLLQQVTETPDSLSRRAESMRNALTRETSLRFLDEEEVREARVFPSLRDIHFARARVEYYYGDPAQAKPLLLSLLLRWPPHLPSLRYYLPALLGTRNLRRLRSSTALSACTTFLRRFGVFRKYFLP